MFSDLVFNTKILKNIIFPKEQAIVLLLETRNNSVYSNWTGF